MKLKFIHPTAAQALRIASIVLTLVDLFLGYASTIKALPFVPAALAMYWPVLLAVAGFLHQAASTFGVSPDASLQAALTKAVREGEAVLSVASAVKLGVAPQLIQPATTTSATQA